MRSSPESARLQGVFDDRKRPGSILAGELVDDPKTAKRNRHTLVWAYNHMLFRSLLLDLLTQALALTERPSLYGGGAGLLYPAHEAGLGVFL